MMAAAIDYTMQHDDGKGEETLDQADLIILGLSRSGKRQLVSTFITTTHIELSNGFSKRSRSRRALYA